ncbi:hypothetical protein RND81_02G077700 [Saponaria officinalis]|uniref:GRF-type domain-containing protein n=1 Tax=Saponaria officinalis TaxID=3572 RepID=A0AAW1MT15_SAPOF
MSRSCCQSSDEGPRKCFCDVLVTYLTSWTLNNPGRGFETCRWSRNGNVADGCNYFRWVDKPQTDWQKELINDLITERDRLLRERAVLKDKVMYLTIERNKVLVDMDKDRGLYVGEDGSKVAARSVLNTFRLNRMSFCVVVSLIVLLMKLFR